MALIKWNGDAVARRVEAAALKGVDETMAACVRHAKSNHPWRNRTGTLEGSLQMRPAESIAGRIVGLWGSFDVAYAIYLEMMGYAYLRPAAQAEYPKLSERITSHYDAA